MCVGKLTYSLEWYVSVHTSWRQLGLQSARERVAAVMVIRSLLSPRSGRITALVTRLLLLLLLLVMVMMMMVMQ